LTDVSISRVHFPVTTLGPGRRVGIWFQGCSIRCPGCISVDTWEPGLGGTSVEAMLASIAEWATLADGLTVSGGEPFEQPEALRETLSGWRSVSSTSILVFTGREFEEVRGWLDEHPGLIDALITGPYRRDLPQTKALRGSDNQELHILTPRGAAFESYDRPRGPEDQRLDVMFDADGGAWFAGIPNHGDFIRFRRALALAGHRTSMVEEGAETGE
jgi:anaerobic ribonucleoside-triphosphate reductase activating protein